MVVKTEVIYEGGTYNLVRDSQTGNYTAEIKALKREIKTTQKVSYYPVLLRITDDAGNITIKTISDAELGKDLLLTVRETEIFPAQFIIADKRGEELAFVNTGNEVDVDIGSTEDFQVELSVASKDEKYFDFGNRLFVPGTEYGGILEDRKTSTKQNQIIYMGYTWRGLLGKKIIYPPEGQTHLTASGEANKIINSIIGSRFGDLFIVDDIDSGINISTFQFERYTTVLAGIKKMLETQNARLKIYYQQGEGLECGAVHLCAVPVVDWSRELEYSQESRINFIARDFRMGINHLVCAGEGEGAGRTVLHLYVQGDGTIGEKQHYFGIDEREALYSYTSQEDIDKLRQEGKKRLKELGNYKSFEITLSDTDVELGDIVGGRDRITGLVVKRPITNKILKIKGGKVTIEYKIKGDD